MNKDNSDRLRKMLEQVNPSGQSQGLAETLESYAAAAEETPGPTLDVLRDDDGEALVDRADEALHVLQSGGEITPKQQFTLEAIVMPYHRPVVDIVNNQIRTDQLTNDWQHLGDGGLRAKIEQCFWSIGRLDVPTLPSLPYAGTGFIVGTDLLMTNRHVANIFSQGVGIRTINFQPGQAAAMDFYHEIGGAKSETLTVEKVLMIHPYWDMALLKVNGLPSNRKPLTLSVTDPSSLLDRDVVVVGYPGYDPTGDQQFQRIQNRIFRGAYYVKRLQPGRLKGRQSIDSFRKYVEAATHDSSTLGGNSGSAVLLLPYSARATVEVVGLHFAGEYLKANYAVPTSDLAQDSRVVDAGVNFGDRSTPSDDKYAAWWRQSEGSEAASALAGSTIQSSSPATSTQSPTPAPAVSWTIPLQVTISLGAPTVASLPTNFGTPALAARPALQPSAARPPLVEGQFFEARHDPTSALPQCFSIASLAPRDFQWQTALSLALASRLAYEDDASVQHTTMDVWKLDSCIVIEKDDTRCFVTWSPQAVVVAFRGTQNLGNWLTNLNVAGTTRSYGVVHRGFLAAFQVVEQQLREALAGLSRRCLLLTGHSLGGALATIMAAEWADQMPASSVYTCGQPAVGKVNFPSFMQQKYGDKFFRFVNNHDVVPRVPPTYAHVGRLFHFDGQGHLESLRESIVREATGGFVPQPDESPAVPPMLTEAEFDQLRFQLLEQRLQARSSGLESLEAPMLGGFPSISDHSMDIYVQKIAAMA